MQVSEVLQKGIYRGAQQSSQGPEAIQRCTTRTPNFQLYADGVGKYNPKRKSVCQDYSLSIRIWPIRRHRFLAVIRNMKPLMFDYFLAEALSRFNPWC